MHDQLTLPPPAVKTSVEREKNSKDVKRFLPSQATRRGVLSVSIALVLWEIIVKFEMINPLFLSSPTEIAGALKTLFSSGAIWNDLRVSGLEFLFGFSLAAVVGILVGVVYGWYKPVTDFLSPFVNILYATPRIALVPVLIIIFGIGMWSKVAIIFLGAVVEILLSTSVGVRTVDEKIVRLARSYGASDFQIFRTVALPHSIPYIVTGLRMGVAHSLTGVVVGELFASQAGVGHVLINSAARFQTDRMYAALVLFAAAGVIFTALLVRLEARFAKWRD